MARPGVTYLDVANAAHKLAAAGKRPTIENVRSVLGTGSNSTLGAHLRLWKEQQDKTQQIATKENLPEELIASLKGLWGRVMENSDDKIQTIQNETQQKIAELKHEIQQLQHDKEHWLQQYQQIKQERDNCCNENLILQQLVSDLKTEKMVLNEKLIAAEESRQQKQEQIESLNKQNQQAQANLEHYRAASLEQRMAEQLRYDQAMQQLAQEMSVYKNELIIWQQKSQQLTFELEKMNYKYDAAIANVNELTSELQSKIEEQQHWQMQCCNIQSKFNEHGVVFAELQTQYALLNQNFSNVKAELHAKIQQNEILAQEKWSLGQEKAQLYGQLKQYMNRTRIETK